MGEYNVNSTYGLTPQKILSKVSEIMLWRYYLGSDFKLGATVHAPYRDDKDASFSLFYSHRYNKIIAKDFGGHGFVGDVFHYVRMVYRLDFYTALVKVNLDFNLGLPYNSDKCRNLSSQRVTITGKEMRDIAKFEGSFKANNTVLQIVARMWEQADLDYWGSFGISKETLKKYDVYPINRLFLNKELVYTYAPDNPGYAYFFPKSGHFKCYFPLTRDKRRKFLGNIDNFKDIQGYYQCEVKGERPDKLLILTKSMKDCMTIRECGYDAMAIHGETQRFHIDFIRHIKKYYPTIISLYDRDASGMQGAKFLWKEYKIKPYFIEKYYGVKDISDMCQTYDIELVKQFLTNITNSKKQTTCVQ
jgi:hypothetical protein